MQLTPANHANAVHAGRRKPKAAFSGRPAMQRPETAQPNPATVSADSNHWRGYLNLGKSIRFSGDTTHTAAVEFCKTSFSNSAGTPHTAGEILGTLLKNYAECDGKPGETNFPHPGASYPSQYLTLLHRELAFENPTILFHIMTKFQSFGLIDAPQGDKKFQEIKLTPLAKSVYEEWSGKTIELGAKGTVTPGAVTDDKTPRIPKDLAGIVTDFTERAATGDFKPLIGRENEMNRIKRAIKKKDIKSIVMVGEPGVGKRAIIEGLAQQIAKGEAGLLNGYRIWTADLNAMVAGTENQGSLEKRVQTLLEEQKKNPNVLLFLEDSTWQTSTEQASETSKLIRHLLANDKSRLIISMTNSGYQMLGRGGESLWNTLKIEPPSKVETLQILEGIAPEYQKEHGVAYSPEVLKYTVDLADKYLNNQPFPAKAIDIMDEAGVLAAEAGAATVSKDHVAFILSYKSGVPLGQLGTDERTKLLTLETILKKRVLGQDHAIEQVSKAIRTSRAQLTSKGKGTMGNFVFTGPTGVGKTELAKALAEWMTGDERNLVRIDMSEYMEPHSVSRLVGAPPGYVGFDEGGQLTEAVRQKPYSVVLLDEMEKAHPAVFNILLQVLDDGRLTDGKGRTVDFKNTIIIMTSNAGAKEITALKQARRAAGAATPESEKKLQDDINKLQAVAFEQMFTPEFRNRIDDIIMFNELSTDLQKQIVELHLNSYLSDVKATAGIEVKLDDTAVDFLKDQLFVKKSAIHDKQSGRKVKDVIKTFVETPMAERKIEEDWSAGDKVLCKLNLEKGKLDFIREAAPAISKEEPIAT